jgi:diguanylate cyclase (GGDEF)-like protein
MTPELATRLKHCVSLPSLPTVALRVVELGQDPEVSLGAVAEVITLDPALAAKILRIANSSLYARQRRSQNLRQALTLLGLNAVLTLALSFSLVGALRNNGQPGLDYRLFWRRSLLSAMCSRALGERLGVSGLEELFLAGLLQDIGMLVLDKALPDQYRPVLAAQQDHERLAAAERERVGCDHAEVGSWLLNTWNLPQYLQTAVAASHAPEGMARDPSLGCIPFCVALSGRLADIWLREDRERCSQDAARLGGRLLGLDGAALAQVMENVKGRFPETESLFDVRLVDAHLTESILEQARETLMMRGLQAVHEVQEARKTADFLEQRAHELEEKARRDHLTGLYSRSHLDGALRQEFDVAVAHGWPLSVVFLDLNRFKRINDEFGHVAGDRALRQAAQWLIQATRTTDLVARYGGEEFVVLLPGIGMQGALIVANRIVGVFEARCCDLGDGRQIKLSVSAGVATHGEALRFELPDQIVAAADRAMYRAKSQPQEPVAVYDPATSPAPGTSS